MGDQRVDLLLSVHRSICFLIPLQLSLWVLIGFFNDFLLNRVTFFIYLGPFVALAIYRVWSMWPIDPLEHRSVMLRVAVMYDVLALGFCLVDLMTRWNLRRDMISTGSPLMMIKSTNDNDISLFADVAVILILARIFYSWWFPSSPSDSPLALQDKGDILRTPDLHTLHQWHLIAGIVSLAGPPCSSLLVASGIYIGAVVVPSVRGDGRLDIFYRLPEGQKRGESDF